MNKLFILIALGSTSLVSADQYSQGSCPSCNRGSYNQGQSNYYQDGNDRQGQQPYNQGSNPNYQQTNRPYDQDQQRNRPYDQNQQGNYDNSAGYQNSGNPSQRGVPDQVINKKISDTLSSGWFSQGFKDVSFDVNNGNVNLSGTVDTIENKNKIEDAVRKIDGVRQVNNQITIAKSNQNVYSESQLQNSEKNYPQDYASNDQDRQLNAQIRDQLNGSWYSKGNQTLVIKTTNGVVTITGVVDKNEDIQKFSNQLKAIDGVKSVNNQLSVKNK